MSDTELTEREAARLRELLGRAADRIEVVTPGFDTVVPYPSQRRDRPRGWLAAAAVVVVAAVGVVWWWAAADGERIDAGPVDAPTAVAPEVLEETGMWRLPEGLDGYRVTSAMVVSGVQRVLIAVDDVDEPTSWLTLSDFGVSMPLDDATRVVELGDGRELVLRPVEGADGVTRFGLRHQDSSAYLTGTYHGIDDEDLIAALSDTLPDAATLTSPDLRRAALVDAELPAGLIATWGPDASLEQPVEASVVGLVDDDGTSVSVMLEASELSPGVAALRLRLSALDLSSIRTGGTPPRSTLEYEPRDDLGPGVLQQRSSWDGHPAGGDGTIVVIAADGTVIMANRAAETDDPLATEPLEEGAQLRIINSLRASSPEQFRVTLDRLGAEFMDPDTTTPPPGVVTTLHGTDEATTTTTTTTQP